MSGLPRILTVDPNGDAGRLVRGVVALSHQPIVQTDVPNATEALAELGRSPYHLLVTAEQVGDASGYDLAQHVSTQAPEIGILLLTGEDDYADDLVGNIAVIRRPFDPHAFVRAILAGINGQDMTAAQHEKTHATSIPDFGPAPRLDIAAVGKIVDGLMREIAPLRTILATRSGEILIERGSEKRLDRDHMTQALLPAMQSTIQMGAVVGGRISVLSFYDGDSYDIFVLTVGYHHFLAVVFDGKHGGKQIGAVRNYAQRAAQDIAALLGGEAYALGGGMATNGRARAHRAGRTSTPVPPPAQVQDAQVAAANIESVVLTPAPAPASEGAPRLQLEPVENFDPALLDQLDALNSADADALFDLDTLAEIAKDPGRDGGALTYDEARRLGIVQ